MTWSLLSARRGRTTGTAGHAVTRVSARVQTASCGGVPAPEAERPRVVGGDVRDAVLRDRDGGGLVAVAVVAVQCGLSAANRTATAVSGTRRWPQAAAVSVEHARINGRGSRLVTGRSVPGGRSEVRPVAWSPTRSAATAWMSRSHHDVELAGDLDLGLVLGLEEHLCRRPRPSGRGGRSRPRATRPADGRPARRSPGSRCRPRRRSPDSPVDLDQDPVVQHLDRGLVTHVSGRPSARRRRSPPPPRRRPRP